MFLILFILSIIPLHASFIPTHKALEPFYEEKEVILIASMGRSASTMLKDIIIEANPSKIVLKTHVLPPKPEFKGKILFIFSNPDKAAESALHMMLKDELFGKLHFIHVESSNMTWFDEINDTRLQTLEHNLLAHDALGITKQLRCWLLDTTVCPIEDAQILAVKYEDLWKQRTIKAIELFLEIDHLEFPTYVPRGYTTQELYENELEYRNHYNLGSWEEPVYSAYDEARKIWEQALPFRFMKIGD